MLSLLKKKNTVRILRLFEAIDDNDLEMAKESFGMNIELSERIELLKHRNKLKRSSLHLACYYGCVKIVEYFMDFPEEDRKLLWGVDKYGNTPANMAMVRGFRKEGDNYIYNEKGRQMKSFLILKSLMLAQCDVSEIANKSMNTPMHWACFHQDLESTQEFLYRADEMLFTRNESGLYPFDLLIEFRKPKVSERESLELLEKIIYKIFNKYVIPYVNYANNAQLDLFELGTVDDRFSINSLKKRTGEPISQGELEYRPEYTPISSPEQPGLKKKVWDKRLGFMSKLKSNKVCSELRLEPSAQFTVIGTHQKLRGKQIFLHHLLLWAVVTDNKIFVETLVGQFGCNPFRVEVFNVSPILMAAKYNRMELMRYLLNAAYITNGKQISADQLREWINTPTAHTMENCMHFAVNAGHYNMALMLIQLGADCNWMSSRGLKPLEIHEGPVKEKIETEWDKLSREKIFETHGSIKGLERKAFLSFSSGYQILIVAMKPKDEDIKHAFVIKELENFRQSLFEQEIKKLESPSFKGTQMYETLLNKRMLQEATKSQPNKSLLLNDGKSKLYIDADSKAQKDAEAAKWRRYENLFNKEFIDKNKSKMCLDIFDLAIHEVTKRKVESGPAKDDLYIGNLYLNANMSKKEREKQKQLLNSKVDVIEEDDLEQAAELLGIIPKSKLIEYKTFDLIRKNDLQIIIGVKICEQCINEEAHQIKMLVYNKIEHYTKEFNKYDPESYEILRNRQRQHILTSMLKKHVPLSELTDLGQVSRHYFLHDFGKLSSMLILWRFWAVLKYFSLNNRLKTLNKINLIFAYMGIEYGIFMGMYLYLKSFLVIILLPVIAYGVLSLIYYTDFGSNPLTAVYSIMLWLLSLLFVKGWRARQIEHFLMLGIDRDSFGKEKRGCEFHVSIITGKVEDTKQGTPFLKRFFNRKVIVFNILVCLHLVLYFLLYKRIWFFAYFNRVSDIIWMGIIGLYAGFVANLFVLLNHYWKNRKESVFVFHIGINLVNFIVVPSYFIQSTTKQETIENVFFACFYWSVCLLHLLFFDVIPLLLFYKRLPSFNKLSQRTIKTSIENFKDKNPNIVDLGNNSSKEFEDFRRDLLIRQQLEFNDVLLPALEIQPELFAVFFTFLIFFYFSIFYPLVSTAFIPFLILKLYLFIRKSESHRRPKDDPHVNVLVVATLSHVVAFSAPVYFGFIFLFKTTWFSTVLNLDTAISTFEGHDHETNNKKTSFLIGRSQVEFFSFAVFEHLLIVLTALYLLIASDYTDRATAMQLEEVVNKRKAFEKRNAVKNMNDPDQEIREEPQSGRGEKDRSKQANLFGGALNRKRDYYKEMALVFTGNEAKLETLNEIQGTSSPTTVVKLKQLIENQANENLKFGQKRTDEAGNVYRDVRDLNREQVVDVTKFKLF
jgi:ankyrin repeat protein